MEEGHLPVLADEVIEMLAPAPGSLHIDATLGGGGHTERILEAANPDGRLLGLDADPAAIARVQARLGPVYGDRLVLRQANFRELRTVAPEAGFGAVDGMLFEIQSEIDRAEQRRFDGAAQQAERFVEDRLLVLRRRRVDLTRRLEEAR
jgi:16S rRNA C1402 N4-methylase RsmH